jgi:hypothetical protein
MAVSDDHAYPQCPLSEAVQARLIGAFFSNECQVMRGNGFGASIGWSFNYMSLKCSGSFCNAASMCFET